MNARRIPALAMVLALVAVSGGMSCSSPSAVETLANPFEASSPWRQEIPSDAPADPNSAAMISGVQAERALHANLINYGIPIYVANADTPTHTVSCTRVDYGVCPFAGWPVAIPDGAEPNSGSDGVLVTVEKDSGIIFEFWRAAHDGNKWRTEFAAVNSLHGSGWGGAATGSGASRLGGVVRVDEIAAGEIPHALALQSNNACPTFRPPALKSDGKSLGRTAFPKGPGCSWIRRWT